MKSVLEMDALPSSVAGRTIVSTSNVNFFFLLSLPQFLLFHQKEFNYGSEILHTLLIQKDIRIPLKKESRETPSPLHYALFG